MQSSTIEPLLTLIQNYQSVLFTSDSQKYFSELSNIAKTLDTNLLVAQEEGRNLRIAIVGQMKAGGAFLPFHLSINIPAGGKPEPVAPERRRGERKGLRRSRSSWRPPPLAPAPAPA